MSNSKMEFFKTNPGAVNHGGKVIYMRKLNNNTINDREHMMTPYHDQRSQLSSKRKLLNQANVKRFNENPDQERKVNLDYQKSRQSLKSVFSQKPDTKKLANLSTKSMPASKIGSIKSKVSNIQSRKSVNPKEPSIKSTKSKVRVIASKEEAKDIDQVEV